MKSRDKLRCVAFSKEYYVKCACGTEIRSRDHANKIYYTSRPIKNHRVDRMKENAHTYAQSAQYSKCE